jgi:hypothetical protein
VKFQKSFPFLTFVFLVLGLFETGRAGRLNTIDGNGSLIATLIGALFIGLSFFCALRSTEGTVANQSAMEQKHVYTLLGQCPSPAGDDGWLIFVSSIGEKKVTAFSINKEIPVAAREHFFVIREDSGELKFMPVKAAS